MKGLIIKKPWIDLILNGEKTWEVRGSNTKIRGIISLIQSGTGQIIGTVELVDSFEVSKETLKESYSNHKIDDLSIVNYKKAHAWVLQNPQIFKEPIPYIHPQGAVIWVNL